MKAEDIFAASVNVMKQVLTPKGMLDSIGRSKLRNEEQNMALLFSQQEAVNEIVREIADLGVQGVSISGAQPELIDAMVLRYLRNRDIFMKTFPEGIENIDTEPVRIWAAIMISPKDETTAA